MSWRADLVAYEESAPESGVDLGSNTNLFGDNPAAATPVPPLSQYPGGQGRVREGAARLYGVRPENVVVGCGSDQLLDLALRAALRPGGTVRFLEPTFSMARILAQHAHARTAAVAADAPPAEAAAALAQADVAYLCRPNNPTGQAWPRQDVEALLQEARGVVVLDEAYVEYLGDSLCAPVRPNLVTLRTLSKAHGLAGIRVGFAIADEAAARALESVGGPYRVPAHSLAVAAAALADPSFAERSVAATLRERPRWADLLSGLGFEVRPSQANFLLARPPAHAPTRELAGALQRRGFRVRTFQGGLRDWVRITIAPAEVRQQFQEALSASLREVAA